MGVEAEAAMACDDGLDDSLWGTPAAFTALVDITDAVMSFGSVSSVATGREVDREVLSAWNVMGTSL